MRKYNGLPLAQQAESYRAFGIREHSGLYACTVLSRKTIGQKRIARLNACWYEENLRWTYQDQLSFPVALRLSGATAAIIPGNLFDNEFFDRIPHKSDD